MSFSCFRVLVLSQFLTLLPAAARADGDAIAIINGRPLNKEEVVRVLLDAHGVEVLQEMILLELARQETRTRRIAVSEADVEREFQTSLDELARRAGLDGADATDANKKQALDTMLEQKGITMPEYRVAIERNAHLRKLIESNLKITEQTLRAEFGRTHGEKRVVRHIQIPIEDTNLLNQAVSEARNASDFADVARRLSQHPKDAARGGELAPFAFDDKEVPAPMREQAFAMEVGEVSNPIKVDKVFQILKLERILPPDTSSFEDVRADLERDMRFREAQRQMGTLASELFNKSKVSVLDSRLKKKYEERLAQSRETAGQP